MVTDHVHRVVGSVNHIQYARRQTGLKGHFSQHHGSTGIFLRRLENHGVSTSSGHREHPKGNHSWEVEGADTSSHPERLSKCDSIDACRYVLNDFSHLVRCDTTGCLDHLKTTKNVPTGVTQCLPLLGCDANCQLIHVLPNKLLKLKHNPGTSGDWCASPLKEGIFRVGHGEIELFWRNARNAGHDVLCCRIDDFYPLSCLGLHPFAADQKWHSWHGGRHKAARGICLAQNFGCRPKN
mmetsp:Transcript_39308/g.47608  ORF Transcript_39308/g.47608 Transcript_39308/m.47608 type:complete len:238 (+) Transcript_39308:1230-1943(+)